MMRRLRLVLLVVRPAVALLLVLYAGIGLSEAGAVTDTWLVFRVLLAVAGFLLFSVACNDIADERIDRVNLSGDQRRPLVADTGHRREMRVIGATSAVLAVSVSATLGWPCLVVVTCGLLCSAGYSVRPVRLADRGAVASLMLPACYVAVPYLLGLLAAGPVRSATSLWLLAGLYVGFIGRILLKDFRDVRGDALFGKRTFLVRHGRRATCVFSACCLAVGAALLLLGLPAPSVPLILGYEGGTVAMIALLRVLAWDNGRHRDEWVISAIAIVGRGMLLLLLAWLGMRSAHWPVLPDTVILVGIALVSARQAAAMFRHGPVSRPIAMPAVAEADRQL
jgi:4-hydroxybenzoate polyprenyltransferase